MGLDQRGCPVGMQIMACTGADFALLDLGGRLQARSLPPVSLLMG
jgi:Asp-tRNA(Asn)/Glu-tRNA(Gln) amidotransferase A subunit family amidase